MHHPIIAKLYIALLCILLSQTKVCFAKGSVSVVTPLEPAHRVLPKIVVPAVSPWGFVNVENLPSGLLIDFQRELFQRAKVKFEAELRPYPRVLHDLASGGADLGVMFKSELAEQSGVSLGHVVTMRIILITPAQSQKKIEKLDDLGGLRVGFIRGSKYGREFDEHPLIEHTSVTNVEQGLRMLVTDRIDALVATEQALLYGMYISGIPSDEFAVRLNLGATQADLYLSRYSQDEPWVDAVREALKTMNEDGSSQRVFYDHKLWSRQAYCFSGGLCLDADEPPTAGDVVR